MCLVWSVDFIIPEHDELCLSWLSGVGVRYVYGGFQMEIAWLPKGFIISAGYLGQQGGREVRQGTPIVMNFAFSHL